MKRNRYTGWIEMPNGKVKRELGDIYALGLKEALIIFQADAIKMGIDYKLVKVVQINYND